VCDTTVIALKFVYYLDGRIPGDISSLAEKKAKDDYHYLVG
jgi:hypothetical protein